MMRSNLRHCDREMKNSYFRQKSANFKLVNKFSILPYL